MSSFMMLLTTFIVRLKMESLSGFTDLVVSITNTKGGFATIHSHELDVFRSNIHIILIQNNIVLGCKPSFGVCY